MSSARGALGDSHVLSRRARSYANEVITGDRWPLTTEHVDLDRITVETSTRMQRKHGVCTVSDDGECVIRLSEKTYERAGFEAVKETIRHELVHVSQYQSADTEIGHGPSFTRWVDPLDLSGRCSNHYDEEQEDYTYTFHCENCGFIGGRYRLCKTVRAAARNELYCRQCESREVEARNSDGLPIEDSDIE